MECINFLNCDFGWSEILSLVAVIISLVTFIISCILNYNSQKRSEKYEEKNRLLSKLNDNFFNLFFVEILQLFERNSIDADFYNKIQNIILEIRKISSFLYFINNDSFTKLKNSLENIDDHVALIINKPEKKSNYLGKIEQEVKNIIKILNEIKL